MTFDMQERIRLWDHDFAQRVQQEKRRKWKKIAIISGVVVTVATIIVVIVLLWPSSKSPPKEGYVLDRNFRESYLNWVPGVYVPGSCSSTGKTVSCSPAINVPGYFQTVPNRWSLLLSNEGHVGWRNVTQDRYEFCKDKEWCAR